MAEQNEKATPGRSGRVEGYAADGDYPIPDYSAETWGKLMNPDWWDKLAMQQKAAELSNQNGTTYLEEMENLRRTARGSEL